MYPPGTSSAHSPFTPLTSSSASNAFPFRSLSDSSSSPPAKTVQFDLRPDATSPSSYREPYRDTGSETDDSDSTVESLRRSRRSRRSRTRSRSRSHSHSRRHTSSNRGHRNDKTPTRQPPPGVFKPPPILHSDSDATIELPHRFDPQGRPIPNPNPRPIFPHSFDWRDPLKFNPPNHPLNPTADTSTHARGYKSEPESRSSPQRPHLPYQQFPPPQQQHQQNRTEFPPPPAPSHLPPPAPPSNYGSTADQKTVDKVEKFLNQVQDFVTHERDTWRETGEGQGESEAVPVPARS